MTGRRARVSREPLALTVLAAVIVFGVWLLERHPGEDWWFGALLTYAPQGPWIIPPAIALVVTLAVRRGLLSFINLVVTAFALFALAGYEMNVPLTPPPGQPTLRVATWNVYGRTEDRELVQARVESWDADIICLQESRLSTFADLLPGYDSVLVSDLRVYVRGHIRSHEANLTGRRPPRYMLVVEADTRAGRITIVNIHVPRATKARSMPREIGPLADYLRTGVAVRKNEFAAIEKLLPLPGPVLIVGDMNTPPSSRYWRELSHHLTDAFAAVGRGFGHTFVWRHEWALLRIDYVWAGSGATPLRCWTERAAPSDHRPVLAEVALPGGSGHHPQAR